MNKKIEKLNKKYGGADLILSLKNLKNEKAPMGTRCYGFAAEANMAGYVMRTLRPVGCTKNYEKTMFFVGDFFFGKTEEQIWISLDRYSGFFKDGCSIYLGAFMEGESLNHRHFGSLPPCRLSLIQTVDGSELAGANLYDYKGNYAYVMGKLWYDSKSEDWQYKELNIPILTDRLDDLEDYIGAVAYPYAEIDPPIVFTEAEIKEGKRYR